MYKKTNYIIPALILCFSLAFLTFPLISFSNGCNGGTTTTTTTTTTIKPSGGGTTVWGGEICHRCESGECTTYYCEVCKTDCSSCKEYKCHVCSGGKCVNRTFNTPCSDTCTSGYDSTCGSGKTCFQCQGTVCKSILFNTACSDDCTGPENCGGTTMDEKEKGWKCPCDGVSLCSQQISTSPQYTTLAQCQAQCPCGIYKYCSTSGCNAGECVDGLWEKKNPGNQCTTNNDCNGGGTTDGTTGTTDGTTGTTGGTTGTTGGTSPTAEPCRIYYFELPARAWVNYSITGRWSASDWCEDCDVTCIPYPECVWKQNNIGIWDEYKFKLSQSGTYTYTLTCYGETSEDKRQEIRIIQAINLPWWREIIPVLPGFLGGIWR